MFLARAADVTGPMDDLEREVALAKGLQGGEITVGMGAYAAQILAADAIARFVASHPQTRVRLVVGAWESRLRSFALGRASCRRRSLGLREGVRSRVDAAVATASRLHGRASGTSAGAQAGAAFGGRFRVPLCPGHTAAAQAAQADPGRPIGDARIGSAAKCGVSGDRVPVGGTGDWSRVPHRCRDARDARLDRGRPRGQTAGSPPARTLDAHRIRSRPAAAADALAGGGRAPRSHRSSERAGATRGCRAGASLDSARRAGCGGTSSATHGSQRRRRTQHRLTCCARRAGNGWARPAIPLGDAPCANDRAEGESVCGSQPALRCGDRVRLAIKAHDAAVQSLGEAEIAGGDRFDHRNVGDDDDVAVLRPLDVDTCADRAVAGLEPAPEDRAEQDDREIGVGRRAGRVRQPCCQLPEQRVGLDEPQRRPSFDREVVALRQRIARQGASDLRRPTAVPTCKIPETRR